MKQPTDKITKELPILGKYEPLKEGEGYNIKLELTEDQMWFIESVAKKYDVNYNAAFHKVWNDAFGLLETQTESRRTYSALPAVAPMQKTVK